MLGDMTRHAVGHTECEALQTQDSKLTSIQTPPRGYDITASYRFHGSELQEMLREVILFSEVSWSTKPGKHTLKPCSADFFSSGKS